MKYITGKNTVLLIMLLSGAVFAEDIKTVDGKVYRNVRYERVEENGLRFRHSNGSILLTPEQLSRKDQRLYAAQIGEYNSQDVVKMRRIEKELDAHLKVLEDRNNIEKNKKALLDSAIKMYDENKPEAFSTMAELIRKYGGTSEAKKGEKLLAEWKKQKLTEVWLHHPGHAGKAYNVYLFNCSEDLESTLKSIVDIHWQVNHLNDQYVTANDAAKTALLLGYPQKADESLALAKTILAKSQEARTSNNKMTEQLLEHAVYHTTINERGMRLSKVDNEYIFFIVEVVQGGKYVYSWCHRAKGGCDLHIQGKEITMTVD